MAGASLTLVALLSVTAFVQSSTTLVGDLAHIDDNDEEMWLDEYDGSGIDAYPCNYQCVEHAHRRRRAWAFGHESRRRQSCGFHKCQCRNKPNNSEYISGQEYCKWQCVDGYRQSECDCLSITAPSTTSSLSSASTGGECGVDVDDHVVHGEKQPEDSTLPWFVFASGLVLLVALPALCCCYLAMQNRCIALFVAVLCPLGPIWMGAWPYYTQLSTPNAVMAPVRIGSTIGAVSATIALPAFSMCSLYLTRDSTSLVLKLHIALATFDVTSDVMWLLTGDFYNHTVMFNLCIIMLLPGFIFIFLCACGVILHLVASDIVPPAWAWSFEVLCAKPARVLRERDFIHVVFKNSGNLAYFLANVAGASSICMWLFVMAFLFPLGMLLFFAAWLALGWLLHASRLIAVLPIAKRYWAAIGDTFNDDANGVWTVLIVMELVLESLPSLTVNVINMVLGIEESIVSVLSVVGSTLVIAWLGFEVGYNLIWNNTLPAYEAKASDAADGVPDAVDAVCRVGDAVCDCMFH